MDLQNRLQEEMKQALRGGQKERLGVIRMLLSDVKNADLIPGKPSAEQIVEAYAKKLRKSREEFAKLDKLEQVQQLDRELMIVEEYLPKKASPEETERLVDEFLSKNQFTEKQFGQAMGRFMKEYGQQVDAAKANELLRRKLTD